MKTQIFRINDLSNEQLGEVAHAIENGAVVALATDTVYGVAADAFNETAIARIYALKGRPVNIPLQILVGSITAAQQLAQWNEQAERLARAFWPGALTLIAKPSEQGNSLLRGFAGLGLRVPKHEGLLQLLQTLHPPLACTSANIHGKPVITREEDLCTFCDGQVEYILTDGTLSPIASSVVDLTKAPTLLREGCIPRRALETILKEPLK